MEPARVQALRDTKALFDDGIITEAQFTKKRQEILEAQTYGVAPALTAPAPASAPVTPAAPPAAPAEASPAAAAPGEEALFEVRATPYAAGTIVAVPAGRPMSEAREAVRAVLEEGSGVLALYLGAHGLGHGGGAGEAASLEAWGLAGPTWLWAHVHPGGADPAEPWRDGRWWAPAGAPAQTERGRATLLAYLRVAVTRRDAAAFERFARNLAELTGGCAPAVLAATLLHKKKRVTAADVNVLASALYALSCRLFPGAAAGEVFEHAGELVALLAARDPEGAPRWTAAVHDGSCSLSHAALVDPVEVEVDGETGLASPAEVPARAAQFDGLDAAALPRASPLHRALAFAPQPGDAGSQIVLEGVAPFALDAGTQPWLEAVLGQDPKVYLRKARANKLAPLPTLSLQKNLSDVPRVCVDAQRRPAVFVGSQSCGSGLVMDTVSKTGVVFDPHELAQTLGDAAAAPMEGIAPTRQVKEMVLLAVDTSNSMNSRRFVDAAPAAGERASVEVVRPRPLRADVVRVLIRFRKTRPACFDVLRRKFLAGGASQRAALQVLVHRFPAWKGWLDDASVLRSIREATGPERLDAAAAARLLGDGDEEGPPIDVMISQRWGSGPTVSVTVPGRARLAAVVDALCDRAEGDWLAWETISLSHGMSSGLDLDRRLDEIPIRHGMTLTRGAPRANAHGPTRGALARERETEVVLTVKYRGDTSRGTVRARWGDTTEVVGYRMWSALGDEFSPANTSLWLGMKDTGDGWTHGDCVYKGEGSGKLVFEQIGQALDQVTDASKRRTLYVYGRKLSQREESRSQSRMDVTKQLFSAFVDRTQAHDLAHELGVVKFSDTAEEICAMTPLYEKFRGKIGELRPKGDTACYDALLKACSLLVARRDAYEGPPPALRVLCFTDGADNKSTATPLAVAEALVREGIILDVVSIAEERSRDLLGLAKLSGGYAFAPASLEDGRTCMTIEVVLSTENRIRAAPSRRSVARRFALARDMAWDVVNGTTVPAIREHESLTKRAVSLEAALAPPAKKARTMPSGRTQRLMRELAALKAAPHPAFDVFPVENDIGVWKVVVAGVGLYERGHFLLGVSFPDDYPSVAPCLRFVTPIRHVNVNRHGRVCHAILEGDYGLDVSVRSIFDCVYGLMMVPDVETAVDADLSSLYYEHRERYDQAVAACTDEAKRKSRAELGESCVAEQ